MRNKKLDQLIVQLENYLECLKQFNYFVNFSRGKKFGPEDENQFLEVKSIIVQELELISAAMECSSPSREEVHTLISSAPSMRYLAESNEGNLRGLENHWHKVYVGFQAILGQLKVKQRELESKSVLSSVFGKKK
ncbi:MAG TPA: hypothetical protein VMQ67_05930 [Candidatus Saccharimonadales bacterium]|jgi:hypothetical protein|nr:hypothetical protein [Candidatus Saccharimonadales bacterium]